MAYEFLYHPDVKTVDMPLLDSKIKSRVKKAIEIRLTTAPHQYGEPLRKNLRGYWKLRVGDYRVVFKIAKNELDPVYLEKWRKAFSIGDLLKKLISETA